MQDSNRKDNEMCGAKKHKHKTTDKKRRYNEVNIFKSFFYNKA